MPSIKGEDVQLERSSKRLAENKSIPLRQLFKIAGTKWKELSVDEKRPYQEAAKGALGPKIKVEDNNRSNENTKANQSKSKFNKSLGKKLGPNRNRRGRPIKYKKPIPRRLRVSPACSNCGHRHGSRLCSEKSMHRRRKYEMDDNSESKSESSISQSTDDSRSSSKSGRSRSQSKTSLFETDVSSISTF